VSSENNRSLCRFTELIIRLENVKNRADLIVELEVNCTSTADNPEKLKAFIHWVSKPVVAEVRLYEWICFASSEKPDASCQFVELPAQTSIKMTTTSFCLNV
jgi:tRNA synthetases class I (E and Q), anti-codon binding domain